MVDRRPRLSDLSAAQILARAAEFRRTAATASTADMAEALLELATRFEEQAKATSGNNKRPGSNGGLK